MLTVKRFIGGVFLAFFGIPILFGIIWAVGICKALVSPQFLSNLPYEIIDELPVLVNEVSSEIESGWHGVDEDTRIWLRAYRDSGVNLTEVMKNTGFEKWLNDDLKAVFLEMGQMFRGERPFANIDLNMRPLKAALLNPILISEMARVITHLPTCEGVDETWWQEHLEDLTLSNGRSKLKIKPCRPADLGNIENTLLMTMQYEIQEIPDTIEVLQSDDQFPKGIFTSNVLSKYMIFLFIIPAVFIFLGALIGATSRASFLRWVGVPTLIGGGLVFILTSMVTRILPSTLLYIPEFRMELQGHEFLAGRILEFVSRISHQLFSPVNYVATIVCAIGLVTIALSYAFNETKKSE